MAIVYCFPYHTYLQSTKSSVEQAPTPPVQVSNSSPLLQYSLASELILSISCSPYQ